jgi:hypothetical protein
MKEIEVFFDENDGENVSGAANSIRLPLGVFIEMSASQAREGLVEKIRQYQEKPWAVDFPAGRTRP